MEPAKPTESESVVTANQPKQQKAIKRSLSDNFDSDQKEKDARESALIAKLNKQFGLGQNDESVVLPK